MEGVVTYGALDVVSYNWPLESHPGMPLAQPTNLLLFIRSLRMYCICLLTGVFTDCDGNREPFNARWTDTGS